MDQYYPNKVEDEIKRLSKKENRYFGRVANDIGNYRVTCNSEFGGTGIVKIGSWRANPRLWKPRCFVKRGGQFPKWVPQYVKDYVKVAEKKVNWKKGR